MSEKISKGAKLFNRAIALLIKGKYDKGLKRLKESSKEGFFNAKRYIAMFEIFEGSSVEEIIDKAKLNSEKQLSDAVFEIGELYEKCSSSIYRKRAVVWYKFAGRQGSVEGWSNAGRLYSKGEGVDISIEDALECYKQSADMGSVDDMIRVANIYKSGEGLNSKSDSKALDYFYMAAKRDNREAMFEVGRAFEGGVSVEVRLDLASEWYSKAAELGEPESIMAMARLSEKSDDEGAKYWYEKAAESGNIYAYMQLGNICERQDSIGEAIKWFRLASDSGSVEGGYRLASLLGFSGDEAMQLLESASSSGVAAAEYNLGLINYNESDNDYERECGVALIEQSAYQEYSEAQLFIGRMLIDSSMPAEQSRAIDYLRGAANQDSAEACYLLAIALINGSGVEADKDRAGKWMRKAALLGYRRAIYLSGVMHEQGYGLWRNLRDAYDSIKSAADLGEPGAIFRLGVYLENGIEKSVDIDGAVELYTKAMELGYAKAAYNLGVLYDNGVHIEKDESKAYSLYIKSAEGGVSEALNSIGSYYHYGKVVNLDLKRAERYYRDAIAKGVDVSKYNLAILLLEFDNDDYDVECRALLEDAKKCGVEQAEAVLKEIFESESESESANSDSDS